MKEDLIKECDLHELQNCATCKEQAKPRRWFRVGGSIKARYEGKCPYGDHIEDGDWIVEQRRGEGISAESRWAHDECAINSYQKRSQ